MKGKCESIGVSCWRPRETVIGDICDSKVHMRKFIEEHKVKDNMKRALIIVDVQNDFLPGRSLGIEDGFEIIDRINRVTDEFDFIVYTQDWHPLEHCSFKQCPVHCVQDTFGSEIHKDLKAKGLVVRKGFNKDIDFYSAFYDNNHQHASGLTEILRANGIEEVYVVGLAYNFCVALHCLRLC